MLLPHLLLALHLHVLPLAVGAHGEPLFMSFSKGSPQYTQGSREHTDTEKQADSGATRATRDLVLTAHRLASAPGSECRGNLAPAPQVTTFPEKAHTSEGPHSLSFINSIMYLPLPVANPLQ